MTTINHMSHVVRQHDPTEGGNPITDASYILILVKICRESGVFPMEIREWSRLPDADKTVKQCMRFFTEAFEHHVEETLQGALLPNATNTATTPTPNPTQKWDYCWTHGLCQHSRTTCRYPAANHKHEATLYHPMGDSSQIRFPGQLLIQVPDPEPAHCEPAALAISGSWQPATLSPFHYLVPS